MNLGQIVLYSKDKEYLSKYLTHILELESIAYEDDIKLFSDEINFIVRDIKTKSRVISKGTIIEFFVDSMEDLDHILQRIRFFYYRTGDDNDLVLPEIETVGNLNYIVIDDPDGRKWKFTYTSYA